MRLNKTLMAAVVAIGLAAPLSTAQAFWGDWWPWNWGDSGWGYPGYGYPYYGGYPGYWGGYPGYYGYPYDGYPYGGHPGYWGGHPWW